MTRSRSDRITIKEERHANNLNKAGPCAQCAAELRHEGTSVLSVLRDIATCGTVDPKRHAYAKLAQPDLERLIARLHGDPAETTKP